MQTAFMEVPPIPIRQGTWSGTVRATIPPLPFTAVRIVTGLLFLGGAAFVGAQALRLI